MATLNEGAGSLSTPVAERLRGHTVALVELFEERLRGLAGRKDLASLIKPLDETPARESLRGFIGEHPKFMVGIDGSMDYDERLEMLFFYVCATAFRCEVRTKPDLVCDIRGAKRDSRLSVSAAVPLWMEDTSDVLGPGPMPETPFELQRSIERVPFSLMTIAELYLGLEAAKAERTGIVLLDRPLSATYAPLSRDLRVALGAQGSSLVSIGTGLDPVSSLDLLLAGTLGPGSLYVPARGPYLVYAAVKALLSERELSRVELAKRLRLTDEDAARAVRRVRMLNDAHGGALLEDSAPSHLTIRKGVDDYWKRGFQASSSIAGGIFHGSKHPLQLPDGRWITVLDLSTIGLLLFHALLHEAWRNRVLVIGVAKDTGATEFSRAVIPYGLVSGYVRPGAALPNLKNDRAFLTALSATNWDWISTPWRSLAYDACFTTLVRNENLKTPLRAARKVVSRERMFTRAYFQLRSLVSDPSVRSPLFLYERPYDPAFDVDFTREVQALERGGEATVRLFLEQQTPSSLDNMVLFVLSRSDNPEVLEALGHNQLLYLADRAAKAEVKAMKGVLRGVADLHLGTLARKRKVFSIMRRYRDLRAESEAARGRAAQELMRR